MGLIAAVTSSAWLYPNYGEQVPQKPRNGGTTSCQPDSGVASLPPRLFGYHMYICGNEIIFQGDTEDQSENRAAWIRGEGC